MLLPFELRICEGLKTFKYHSNSPGLLVRPENCLEEEMIDLLACLATDNILKVGFRSEIVTHIMALCWNILSQFVGSQFVVFAVFKMSVIIAIILLCSNATHLKL